MSLPITPFELDRIVGRSRDHGACVPPFCVKCNQDLRGCPSPRCPECGESFVTREWKARAGEMLHLAKELQDANAWASRGFWIGCVAILFGAINVFLRGLCLGDLSALGALFLGAASFFLGLGVFAW